MTYQIALSFEDGVTRFVDCRPGETVADASYRAGINIPLDCRDGACGTCKGFCESGRYQRGDYIEDALTEAEAEEGYVLACQMRPEADCVVRIAATSDVCKTSVAAFSGEISALERLSETAWSFSLKLAERSRLAFLPGQYVNIQVPGTDQQRSYSFSSSPRAEEVSFLVRNTPAGALTSYLRTQAALGAAMGFTGPLGSFYLRDIKRPLLFLAGGTGLAPFLAMLGAIEAQGGSPQPIHLIYGVTNDADLVELDRLEALAAAIPGLTFACCVADAASAHPRKGFVTHHMAPEHLNGGEVDVYLCGPPAMVDAVRAHMAEHKITPANFYFEKFANSGVVTATGETHAAKAA